MCLIVGMSAQDFALTRASELVETDPGAAFDLLLASDELDKTAAKRPEVIRLNRALRGIKTQALKFLAQKVSDLIWSAGDNYDYIGLGTTVQFFGAMEAGGRTTIRIEVNFIASNPRDETPDEYRIDYRIHGKGGRDIGGEMNKLTFDDIKRKPQMWLGKAPKIIGANLKGSLDAEKAEMLAAIDEAIDAHKQTGPQLKAVKKLIQGSKNIMSDASAIRRAVTDNKSGDIEYPLTRIRNLLDRITRAGG